MTGRLCPWEARSQMSQTAYFQEASTPASGAGGGQKTIGESEDQLDDVSSEGLTASPFPLRQKPYGAVPPGGRPFRTRLSAFPEAFDDVLPVLFGMASRICGMSTSLRSHRR